jgi:hypothetical protein
MQTTLDYEPRFCPECGVNWDEVKKMIAMGVDHFQHQRAMDIISNCYTCQNEFMGEKEENGHDK